jgi:hypothetical protein
MRARALAACTLEARAEVRKELLHAAQRTVTGTAEGAAPPMGPRPRLPRGMGCPCLLQPLASSPGQHTYTVATTATTAATTTTTTTTTNSMNTYRSFWARRSLSNATLRTSSW